MLATLLVVLAQAGVVNGEVVVVADTTGSAHSTSNIIAGVGSTLCAFASRGVYFAKPDVFDVVVAFTTNPLTGVAIGSPATPKGTIVRASGSGYAYGSPLIVLQPGEYGSAARLSHCVFMGPVQNLPVDPDADFLQPSFPSGTTPSGVTGIEVLGHELGHHWLVQSAFDQGNGLDVLHRADSREPLMGTQMNRVSMATLHYSHLTDSHSVMYGNFITALGGGQYRLEGGARKYGAMDQYLMGLRAAEDTPPMRVLDDGSGMGVIDTPLRRGESEVVSANEVQVSVVDFVRAQGVRTPAFPNAKRCFRLAFVLVTQQGTTASADQLALVDAYRRRFEGWFSFATDGRANAVTSLDVFEPCPEPSLEPDAGTIEPRDAGVEDAGTLEPEPEPMIDAGVYDPSTNKFRPGCDCTSAPALGALLCGLVLLRRTRKRN